VAREMLYDRLFRHAVKAELAFSTWERFFRGLPVYDITNVIPLVAENDPRKPCPVPMKPPHDLMWAEWRHQFVYGGGWRVDKSIGLFIFDVKLCWSQQTCWNQRDSAGIRRVQRAG
jgi:hypothetical protein